MEVPTTAIEVSPNFYWVGGLDPNLRVFDIVMTTPFGTTYNSFLLKGQKANVLFETVKENFYEDFEKRLNTVLKANETIDYVVLNHTEPDHSGALHKVLDRFPNATVVATQTAHTNLEAITYRNYKKVAIETTETAPKIDVGGFTLTFIVAPFLHWPDTMLTYVPEAKALVSCDFLGSHYCHNGICDDVNLIGDAKLEADYISALKGYYDPIFGPFKPYVLKAFGYLKDHKLEIVCCSHGPVLRKGIDRVIEKYKEWSVEPELEERVVIAYVSAYKYTRMMAETIHTAITKAGVPAILYDMQDTPVDKVVGDIARSKGFILGTPTIVGDALPPIAQIAGSLNPIIHRDHICGVFGSYGWSGEGVRNIAERMVQLRFRMPLDPLKVRFKPNEEILKQTAEWGTKFARAMKGEVLQEEKDRAAAETAAKPVKLVEFENDGKLRRWRCILCGEIVISVLPPEVCRACGAGREAFVCLGLVETDAHAPKPSKYEGNVVIIGGGCAAVSALKAIKEVNDTAKVTVVCGEAESPYYRPSLTFALAEPELRKDPTFRLLPEKWCEQNKVEFKQGVCATSLDTSARKVTLCNKEEITYDKLIIATGGNNFVPVQGLPKTGTFNVRTLSDVDHIVNYVKEKNCSTAIVCGGGLAGLETAEALIKLGLKVHVIEMVTRVLPRQLTEEGSKVYSEALRAAGVNLHLGTCISEVKTTDAGVFAGVALKDGTTIAADILCLGVGTTPNVELAKAAGVWMGKRAIIVNASMETNVPSVYACGDCVEYQEGFVPTWPEALAQGRTAGLNAVGATKVDGATFKREPSPYFLPSFVPVFSIGKVTPESHGNTPPKVVSFTQPPSKTSPMFCELYFDPSTAEIVGAQIIGKCAKELQTPLAVAIGKKASMTEVLCFIAPVVSNSKCK